MKLTLTDYQEKAAAEVLDGLDEAVGRFNSKGKLTAVSLTAVTGAGKTVMATAILEALLHGSDSVEPTPQTTVLWLTDDPSLNEQTRRKMLVASELIQPGQLITVDESLDQRVLDVGRIYFLNIQKLGKGASKYINTGDSRQHGLWEIISETIRERGENFLLVVDEAHRGTSSSNGERKTIASRLIHGDPTRGVPPSPIVLGISATPERFHNAVHGSGRTLEPVTVDVDEVRKSGLIKDLVSISYPDEAQPGDATLLERAATDVREYATHWDDYTAQRSLADVQPVLVVQVKSGTSHPELQALVATIHSAWEGLDDKAIAHCFQDHARLDLGDHTVRYIAPQDVQDDPHLRVVLFKEALTTGWDCPRAEVMISLRTAADHTYIAQLIGRMVRTPLARRVAASELLNSVSLYLPHFNEDSVEHVIAGLRSGEAQVASEISTSAVTCRRNPDVAEGVWDVASQLPTYTRPAKVHRNDIARLAAFAQLLASSGVDKQAPAKAKQHVVSAMKHEAQRLGEALEDEIAQLAELEYKTKTVTVFESEVDSVVSDNTVDVSERNVNDLFRQARRRFGDAAAQWYWNAVCDEQEQGEGEEDALRAKLQVAALSLDVDAVRNVQDAAAKLIASLRKEHASTIADLSDDDRERIYTIFQQSKDPQQVELLLPDDISANAPKGTTTYAKHLYANGNKEYPAQFNDWEQAVLDKLLPAAEAWYRNPTAGRRAIGVPYSEGSEKRTMYPDFVIFRKTGGDDGASLVADIIDPHAPNQADTASKWIGLAEYAQDHRDRVGKALAVIRGTDERMWQLDLRAAEVLEALKKSSGEADIRKIFADYGGHL